MSGEVAKEWTKPSDGEQRQHLGTGEQPMLCYQGSLRWEQQKQSWLTATHGGPSALVEALLLKLYMCVCVFH